MIPVQIVATERQENFALMNWVNHQYEIREVFLHIANEYKGNAIGGKIRQRIGVKPGVSDYFLPIPKGNYHGLWIELKRKKNAICSVNQKVWIEKMQNLGYAAYFCYGADEAIKCIKTYMDIKPNAEI